MALDYSRYNILVAEDNYINQKLLSKLLSKKGYNSFVVEDGEKVLKALEERKFDAVLMDIQMPLMDGYQATTIIRQREKESGGRHVPIIGITAFAMESDRQKCFEIGMDDYLSKPFNKDDFYDIIEKHVTNNAESHVK